MEEVPLADLNKDDGLKTLSKNLSVLTNWQQRVYRPEDILQIPKVS